MLLPYVITLCFWYQVLSPCKWICCYFCPWAGSHTGSARARQHFFEHSLKRSGCPVKSTATVMCALLHSPFPQVLQNKHPRCKLPFKGICYSWRSWDCHSQMVTVKKGKTALPCSHRVFSCRLCDFVSPKADCVLSELIFPFSENDAWVLTWNFSCTESKYFTKVEQHHFIRLRKWVMEWFLEVTDQGSRGQGPGSQVVVQ